MTTHFGHNKSLFGCYLAHDDISKIIEEDLYVTHGNVDRTVIEGLEWSFYVCVVHEVGKVGHVYLACYGVRKRYHIL